METIKDYLDSIEITLIESDPDNGKYPNHLVHAMCIVWQHSIYYLVSKGKLSLSDSADDWRAYQNEYQMADHYKVANAYLQSIGEAPLQYDNEIFHSYKKRRPA